MKCQRMSLVTLLFCCTPFLIYSQSSDKAYDFPVKPGTEEWKQLKTKKDRMDAYNIPDKALKNMSTTALVKTCMNYPRWGMLMTRNSLQLGYDFLKANFNGFAELETRPDAGIELLKLYQRMSPEKVKELKTPVERGKHSFNFMYIQLLLSQPAIIKNMDEETQEQVLERSTQVYDSLALYPENYGYPSRTNPAVLMGRIMKVQNEKKGAAKKESNPQKEAFVERTEIAQPEVVAAIVEEARARKNKSIK